MKYSQLQWAMNKYLHLRDCGSIPLSARTNLLLLQRKETYQKKKKKNPNKTTKMSLPKPQRKKERKTVAKKECKFGYSPGADSLPWK